MVPFIRPVGTYHVICINAVVLVCAGAPLWLWLLLMIRRDETRRDVTWRFVTCNDVTFSCVSNFYLISLFVPICLFVHAHLCCFNNWKRSVPICLYACALKCKPSDHHRSYGVI